MNSELFVENAFALTPKDILRNIQRIRKIGTSADDRRADIDYWLEDPSDPSVVFVSITGKEPQRLDLEWLDLTYGKRAYFLCQCGLRTTKLHLPLNGQEFKCRKCHNLQYQLTTFNRHSIAGRSLYKMNRLQKLSESRANMGRILYNGNYTKKFQRFLGLCERAGLESIVQGANDLMALLKG